MECIPSCNPTSSAGSSSSSSKAKKMSKEEKGAAEMKKSKKGVIKLSTDPQSVAARERRHRISDRFKILQSMVPGGSKMDTASMLEEAINYVKFLQTQIWLHETVINFVYDESSMFLRHQDYFPYEQIFSLQKNTSVSFDDSLQTLSQLPLDQWYFNSKMKNIPPLMPI